MSEDNRKWEVGIAIICVVYMALFGLDVVSTVINGELVKYLEANPLYHAAGMGGVVVLNLLVVLLFWWGYSRCSSVSFRHTLLFILTVLCVIRVLVIWNNFQVFLNPISVEVAAAIPQEVKVKMYRNTIWVLLRSGFLMFLPAWIAFWAFCKDHKVIKHG